MSCLSIYLRARHTSIYFLSLDGSGPSGTAGSRKYIPRPWGVTGYHSGISIYLQAPKSIYVSGAGKVYTSLRIDNQITKAIQL